MIGEANLDPDFLSSLPTAAITELVAVSTTLAAVE
jgi:hypothetical protein